MPSPLERVAVLLASLVLALAGCAREERRFRDTPAVKTPPPPVSLSELQPGRTLPPPAAANPFEGNVWAIAEGRRLYGWFNCSGCHFQGGGGIGPALIDSDWIYGSDPAQVYASIVEGRPNGMPAFRGYLTDRQVWQLVAYVRDFADLKGPSPVDPDAAETTPNSEER